MTSGSAPTETSGTGRLEGRGLTVRRWIVLCACAETIGMTASSLAAKIAQRVLGDDPHGAVFAAALAVVVAGGLVEGGALGALQARGLRRRLPRLNAWAWFAVTTAVAGVGWAVASAPGVLSTDEGGPEPPLLLVLAGALALGAVMGAVLGGAQAAVLRRVVDRPPRWILANTLAWPPTMAVIFLGATTPTSTWSVPAVGASGAVTGLVAGTVLGVVTGRYLPGASSAPSSERMYRSSPWRAVAKFRRLARSHRIDGSRGRSSFPGNRAPHTAAGNPPPPTRVRILPMLCTAAWKLHSPRARVSPRPVNRRKFRLCLACPNGVSAM